MNILENYIVEIHDVSPCEEEWTKEFKKDFVKVDMTSNCYGNKTRKEHIFTVGMWGEVKSRGYYMA